MIDEGYIKFNCDWKYSDLPKDFVATELLSFRQKVFELGLIGYDEKEKVGFGNISVRFKENQFIISGTQTGHIKNLNKENLSLINDFEIESNAITAFGPAKPSSESLTHAAIYKYFKNVNAVIHVHSEKMWRAQLNKIPTTKSEIPYGTPAMALAVKDLFAAETVEGIFVMGGHKDGIVAFGKEIESVFNLLFSTMDPLDEI